MVITLNGTLIEKSNIITYGNEKKYKRSTFVIRTKEFDNNNNMKVDYYTITASNDKCDIVDKISEGSDMTILVTIRGIKYFKNDKDNFFNVIELISVKSVTEDIQKEQETVKETDTKDNSNNNSDTISDSEINNTNDDGLPF